MPRVDLESANCYEMGTVRARSVSEARESGIEVKKRGKGKKEEG